MEDYSKSTPPGWQPYMNNYPLKLYKEKLELWKTITDVDEAKQGPALVGRLKGAAYGLAMSTRFYRQSTGITYDATRSDMEGLKTVRIKNS